MIKPHELFIGAVVLYDSYVGWEEYTIDASEIAVCEFKPEAWNVLHKPLPITPEVLDRAGFFTGFLSNKQYGFQVEIRSKSAALFISEHSHTIMVENIHFHDLQRLYLSLTGELLTLKPKL